MPIVISSLIAQYKCNETSGTNVVDNINGYNGTASVDLSTITTVGLIGSAFGFTAAGGVNITVASNNDLKLLNDFSIEFWMKYNDTSINTGRAIIAKSNMWQARGWAIDVYRNAINQAIIKYMNGVDALEWIATYNQNKHFVFTYVKSTKTANLYEDAISLGEKNTTVDFAGNDSDNMIIGAGNGYANIGGTKEIIRLYSSALDSGTIINLYNGGSGTEDVYKQLMVPQGCSPSIFKKHKGGNRKWRQRK